jgi:hypothetical protein
MNEPFLATLRNDFYGDDDPRTNAIVWAYPTDNVYMLSLVYIDDAIDMYEMVQHLSIHHEIATVRDMDDLLHKSRIYHRGNIKPLDPQHIINLRLNHII